MAYDRYDPQRRGREGSRSYRDEPYSRASDRDRGDMEYRGERDERGFFERAGDQVRSWFGDEESERGRGRDPDREERWRRDRYRESSRYGRDEGDDLPGYRPMTWVAGERDYNRDYREELDQGQPRDRRGSYEDERGERSDYGTGSRWDRDEYRRTSFAGSRARSNPEDLHYEEWRRRQMEDLDRDYDEYRRECESRFDSDFGSWRERRQTKRQLLRDVREHMEVVGSDDEHVGTIDRVAGDRIILTKGDPESGGAHHSLSCTEIGRIEGDRVVLDVSAEQARQRWRDESRGRALFEREDQGRAGPHVLDRSFSGTYR
jgi:hypothetical protein